jgi:uncharacterized alkaline shock family protein YloU
MNTKMNQRTDDRTFADEMRFTSTEPMNGGGEKKDVDDVASVLETENGRTVIQSEVVAKFAGMAMREVVGVYSLAPYGAGQALTRLTSRVSGKQMRELGIHVETGKIEAAVDARIIVRYGHSLIDTAQAVRDRVTERLSQMTGLRVVEVNVEIVDLHFPADDREDRPVR